MRYLLAALVLFTIPARADDMVYRYDKDSVRLTSAPCPEAVLSVIPEPIRSHFKAAFAMYQGKGYAACWAVYKGENIFVQYEDGDMTIIPVMDFKREPGI